MKTLGLLLAGSIALSTASSGAVGTWRNFTCMKEVRGLTREGTSYWAATAGGLFEWNPADNSYQRFTNAEGLQSTDLTAVGIDRQGNIWTGSSTGFIHVYTQNTQTWRYILDFVANRDLTNRRVNSFTMLGDSVLVCTEFGLSIFRIGSFGFGDTYKQFGSLQGNVRVAVSSAVEFNDSLWLTVTDGNVGRIAVASLSTPNLLPPEAWSLQTVGGTTVRLRQLTVFNGKIYVATSSGLFEYNSGTWTAIPSLANQNVIALNSTSNLLGVGTSSGTFTVDSHDNVLQTGTVLPFGLLSVSSDPAGNPVVGSNDGGILSYSVPDSSWHSHLPNGPNSNFFINLAVGPDGSIWSGTGISGNGTGVNRFDGKLWKSYTVDNSGLPTNDCYRVSAGCNGSIWVSSWGSGVFEIPQGSDRVDSAHIYGRNVGMVGLANNLDYIVVTTAVCDGRGNTWMSVDLPAGEKILSVKKADGGWVTLPVKVGSGTINTLLNNLPVDRSLAIDAYDNVWGAARGTSIGNFHGVFSLNNGGAIDDSADFFLTSADGLPSNEITTIVVDRDNSVWVGTDQGIGIILDPLEPKRIGAVAAYVPLRGAVINCIAVDALNQKWVGTTEGVVVLSPDGTQQVATYTVASTNGKIIDDNVKSIAIDHNDGTVYFGTLSGLASIRTFSITPRPSFETLKIRPRLYIVPSDTPMTIGSLNENTNGLAGLFQSWTVKILTIDGRPVRELRTTNESVASWDGTDNTGQYVASGVYIVVAFSEDGSSVAKGKMAVIRR